MEGRPTSYSSAKLRSAKPRAGLLTCAGWPLPPIWVEFSRPKTGNPSTALTVARPRGIFTRFPILFAFKRSTWGSRPDWFVPGRLYRRYQCRRIAVNEGGGAATQVTSIAC